MKLVRPFPACVFKRGRRTRISGFGRCTRCALVNVALERDLSDCMDQKVIRLSILLWSAVATVRLTHWAQQLPTMKLASSKSIMLATFSLIWLLGVAISKISHGEDVLTLWAGAGGLNAWLLVLWSALGAGAISIYLQTLVFPSPFPITNPSD